MTLEEYKRQVFKTDGDGQGITIGSTWNDIPRKTRKHIISLLKKGKNHDFADTINNLNFYE